MCFKIAPRGWGTADWPALKQTVGWKIVRQERRRGTVAFGAEIFASNVMEESWWAVGVWVKRSAGATCSRGYIRSPGRLPRRDCHYLEARNGIYVYLQKPDPGQLSLAQVLVEVQIVPRDLLHVSLSGTTATYEKAKITKVLARGTDNFHAREGLYC